MMNRKNNYLMLSLFIVYMIIAIIQFKANGLLPAWLYVSIAFVTVNISICEALKSSLTSMVKILKSRIAIKNKFINNLNKCITIYDRFDNLNKEKEMLVDSLNKIKERNDCERTNKRIKKTEKVLHFFEFFEIFSCTVILFITPLKAHTYDIITNKMISAMSLISFSLMFLSIYINNNEKDIDFSQEADLYFEKFEHSMMILEKLSADYEDKKQEGE